MFKADPVAIEGRAQNNILVVVLFAVVVYNRAEVRLCFG